MSNTILFTDLHLLVYRERKNIHSYLCPSEDAMRRKVERLAEDFEDTVDDIMTHLNQLGSHEEGDLMLLAPDMELCDDRGMPSPWPGEAKYAPVPSLNHYLVTGHLEGDHEDHTRYVVAPVVSDAETIFKGYLARFLDLKHEESKARIMVTLAVQIQGPPIAIYTEDGVEENPEPIQ